VIDNGVASATIEFIETVAMANTYTSLHYHIVFSTKNRVQFLKGEIEQRIWAYIGGIARKHGIEYDERYVWG
jgi:REP element-mobilizing transposase RayT